MSVRPNSDPALGIPSRPTEETPVPPSDTEAAVDSPEFVSVNVDGALGVGVAATVTVNGDELEA